MSNLIKLQSESGRWQYNTTTDDPLFATFLGDMQEEGMVLGGDLVIRGELGIALEREWKYIDILFKWIEWERKAAELPELSYIPFNWAEWERKVAESPDLYYIPIPTYNTITSQEIVKIIGSLPPPTLWLHQISVLSRVLDLPEGWQVYTAVDEISKLEDRIHHMQFTLSYMRKHINYARISIGDIITQDARWLILRTNEENITGGFSTDDLLLASLLIPFARNVWLINRDSMWQPITLVTYLDKIDWEVILPWLTPYSGKKQVDRVLDLAKVMTGEIVEYLQYTTLLKRTYKGIETESEGYKNNDTIFTKEKVDSSLMRVYTRLLSYLPDDTSPERMGLNLILGIIMAGNNIQHYCIDTVSDVYINNLVAWIHMAAITQLQYEKWYSTIPSNKRSGKYKGVDYGQIKVEETEWPEIIKLIGDRLGINTLNRMALSLLYYIENKSKNDIHTERADKFAALIEKYIERTS